jgi:hypothetical protein
VVKKTLDQPQRQWVLPETAFEGIVAPAAKEEQDTVEDGVDGSQPEEQWVG